MAAYAVKTPPQHGTWSEILELWQAADDIDVFESAWTMDHFYPLSPPLDGTELESWTLLAALAQATRRLRLGCMVNGMHFRHPAVTANMRPTLDHIAGGRFDLGLGAGWFEPEADAYGIPLGTLTERFDRFDEGVEVIVSLLTRDVTTFSGRYYRLADARCEPKARPGPHPHRDRGPGPPADAAHGGPVGRPLGRGAPRRPRGVDPARRRAATTTARRSAATPPRSGGPST